MNDLISVIVPVYNTQIYLSRCIESILSQSYGNIEVILIDDGSTDNSGSICDEYAQKDDRIIVIHKKNQGLSSARNQGINRSIGKYICFVDSDDWINERYIELLYKAIIETNADLAICNFEYVYDVRKGVKEKKVVALQKKICTGKEALRELMGERCVCYVVAWNKMYKKELWKNLYYPKGFIHEDEAVVHRILARSTRVVCIEEELYYYRQVQGSIMNAGRNVKHMDKYTALADRIVFLRKKLSQQELRKICFQYWYEFMENYYFYYGQKEYNKYLRRMKLSMFKAFGALVESKFFSVKDAMSIVVFLFNSALYKKLFLK